MNTIKQTSEPSKLYNFYDRKENYAIQLFNGQKVVEDLAIAHPLAPAGFQFLRNMVLSFQPLTFFLKSQESFGIYIDSQVPYFRFKLELSFEGKMRALFLPQNFTKFPDQLTGLCRVIKMQPHQKSPYMSVIEMTQKRPQEIINDVLAYSYQGQCELILSEQSDQSLLIQKLPKAQIDKEEVVEVMAPKEYLLAHKKDLLDLVDNCLDESTILQKAEELGLEYLKGQEILFSCSCGRELMLNNLKKLAKEELDLILKEDGQIQTECDYCHKIYTYKEI